MTRYRTFFTVAAAIAAIAGTILIAPGSASAHERRMVAGKYTFVVGFLVEPAYVEDANGVSLTVSDLQSNQPVKGVEKTLKVEVSAGGATKTMDLKTVFGRDGAYKADFIPTKAGGYSFRFFGNIDGTEVNEKFESGPGRFDDVQAKSAVQFPASVPSNGELAQQVQGARPVEGSGPAAGGATSDDAQRALDKATSARNTAIGFGIAGIVIGLAGIGTGVYALRSRNAVAGGTPRSGRNEPV
jgi:hypothetical protein